MGKWWIWHFSTPTKQRYPPPRLRYSQPNVNLKHLYCEYENH